MRNPLQPRRLTTKHEGNALKARKFCPANLTPRQILFASARTALLFLFTVLTLADGFSPAMSNVDATLTTRVLWYDRAKQSFARFSPMSNAAATLMTRPVWGDNARQCCRMIGNADTGESLEDSNDDFGEDELESAGVMICLLYTF